MKWTAPFTTRRMGSQSGRITISLRIFNNRIHPLVEWQFTRARSTMAGAFVASAAMWCGFHSIRWMVAATLCATGSMRALDWPQLLGPTRDAVYSGPPLSEKWPDNGPRVVWSKSVGEGYSNPIL